MNHERQELRIAALLDALDQEHARVREAMTELKATSGFVQQDLKNAAAQAAREALEALRGDVESARRVVVDLQGLSLWRAAWQHVMVAMMAILITVLAVWWYVPSGGEVQALRTEKAQLEASIVELDQRGARMQHSLCGAPGDTKRFCVLVPKRPEMFVDQKDKGLAYVVPVGY